MFYKPEIRQKIRARRKQLDSLFIQQASHQIALQLVHLPRLIDSQHIAYYLPQEGEVDPAPIVQCERHQHKKFYLPTIAEKDNKILSFYSYNIGDLLITNHYQIQEPDTTTKKPFATQQLDIVFLPLVAFDKHGNRIGRGAGYYDRTFAFMHENSNANKKPFLIGLGYEFQKVEDIVPSAWDIPLNIIVTEKEIYPKI